MKKTAFLFPGQGSQKIGMGQDLYDAHDQVRDLFDTAENVSNLPIKKLCFEGPMETLTQTINVQPAITTINLACLSLVEAAGIKPDYCAGHSLGEYGALRAAGVISDADCLKLVFERGRLMQREATAHAGAMSAIIGMDIDQVNEVVDQAAASGVVAVANHNSAEQIVITGSPEAVAAAGDIAAEQGGRAIALKVSGAWHSPLIKGAEDEFKAFLEQAPFSAPVYPVLHNVTAATADSPEDMRSLMARQLCSPVRWYDTVQKMMDAEVDVYVEIGPGKVLAGLMKKMLPKGHQAEIYNVSDLKTLDAFLTAIQ